jgi:heme/copper-type cytochrome/quinol oxidase subunit 3
MKSRAVLDISRLPLHGLGSASVTWWGNLAFMLIEGSAFAVAVAVYLYLWSLAPSWPLGAAPPDLGPGTTVTVLLLLSLIPNHFMKRWAAARDLGKVRVAITFMTACAAVVLAVRVYEFHAFHVAWDDNAYGSIVWLLLGLHTTHLLTDTLEGCVLIGVMWSRHGDNKRRYGDIEDNADYWLFVVLTWLPIYGCLYWIPRL